MYTCLRKYCDEKKTNYGELINDVLKLQSDLEKGENAEPEDIDTLNRYIRIFRLHPVMPLIYHQVTRIFFSIYVMFLTFKLLVYIVFLFTRLTRTVLSVLCRIILRVFLVFSINNLSFPLPKA